MNPAMKRRTDNLIEWLRTHPDAIAAVVGAVIVIVLLASVGVYRVTASPSFCNSCHEMRPYRDAWAAGTHDQVPCAKCHVAPGIGAQVRDKFETLREVVVHTTGDPKFPSRATRPVSSRRCLRCHRRITTSIVGFDHGFHARRKRCPECHPGVGHRVSVAALKRAGIYNEKAAESEAASEVASLKGGEANIAGHQEVACTRCHDMRATGCPACHVPRHEASATVSKEGDCANCHPPGGAFRFMHPAAARARQLKCSSCHVPPANHYRQECSYCHPQVGVRWQFKHVAQSDCVLCHPRPANHRSRQQLCQLCHNPGVSWGFRHPSANVNCEQCHRRPQGHFPQRCPLCHRTGIAWAFVHPRSNRACTECHDRPRNHFQQRCSLCHTPGRTWAFRHPSSGSTCTGCHRRPANHFAGACTRCHRTGVSWGFRHPSRGGCTDCHRRPRGHYSGACTSCHNPGGSWRFRHPSSRACNNCHNPPRNHYGSACASCHSPSRSWGSATFRHPRIPGGEHSYRSFACSRCHPNGFGSYSCASCHDSRTGPDGDGDDD